VAKVTIPEAGAYRLFVRSQGTATSGFKVSVDGETGADVFGNGPLAWKGWGKSSLAEALYVYVGRVRKTSRSKRMIQIT
jgi:hypothetical protein